MGIHLKATGRASSEAQARAVDAAVDVFIKALREQKIEGTFTYDNDHTGRHLADRPILGDGDEPGETTIAEAGAATPVTPDEPGEPGEPGAGDEPEK